MHYHNCPTCYEKYECNMDCSIESELQEGDKHFGSHDPCFTCVPLAGYDNKGNKTISQEQWFRQYNGFRDNSKREQAQKNPYEPLSQDWWGWYNGFI